MTRSVAFEGDIASPIEEVLGGLHGPRPGIIIETGPYHGLGSSTQLALANSITEPTPHIALEAVYDFVEKARENLKDYPWIEVIHALPTGLKEAREFVIKDKWVLENLHIPHDYEDPVAGYLWELSDEHLGIPEHNPQEYWFARHLPKYRDKMPFFFLDSGGGTGWLEYQTMKSLMHGYPYYCFLDDMDHTKHYRSYTDILLGNFDVLALEKEENPRWGLFKKA